MYYYNRDINEIDVYTNKEAVSMTEPPFLIMNDRMESFELPLSPFLLFLFVFYRIAFFQFTLKLDQFGVEVPCYSYNCT